MKTNKLESSTKIILKFFENNTYFKIILKLIDDYDLNVGIVTLDFK